jgi:2-polyprenyl-3-methyl-5-hydroxy-6-metoxy-1,4-benzoquinol methylase
MATPSTRTSYTGARADVTGLRAFTPQRSLDIGCSNGNLSAAFRALGAETWGVEYDPTLAAEARSALNTVLQGDGLERARDLADAGEQFDTIVCADVLEHMTDPWRVMAEVRRLISPDGQVLVSLPNVGFYTTIVGLLVQGRWRYADRGVHDRTHLRWFTDRNARDMFTAAGFRVEEGIAHYRLFDRPSRKLNRPAKLLARGPLKGLLAYQYVYRLRPS